MTQQEQLRLVTLEHAIQEILLSAAEALLEEGIADWGEGGRLGDALIGIKDCAESALKGAE